jgi:hypothetical protein
VNWTRGLFRLWLVLSIFWIAGAVTLAWIDQKLAFPERNPTKEEIKKCNEQQYVGNYMDGIYSCQRRYATYFNEDVSFQEMVFSVNGVYLLVVFGAPVAILSLGVMGVWILAGFKNER